MTEKPETQLKQAQEALQSGAFERGLALAEEVLGAEPGNSEALYMAAVALRFLKRHDDAQLTLQRLHAATPEYGRAWQEAGHLARDTGDAEAAIAAYGRAVQFNPALAASWSAQAQLLSAAGRRVEADAANAQADRLAQLPRELLAVTNHLHEGRLLHAEQVCRAFLQKNPRNVEGMRLLAQIGIKLGILDDAEFLLESAVEFEPDNVQLRLDYMDALRRRQKFEKSREQAETLFDRDPQSPLFQSHLAIESMQTGDYDRAFGLFEKVLEKLPNDPSTLTSRGHALKTTGDQERAVASYQAAFSAKPDHGDAYYALANLKTYTFPDSEMDAMRRQVERPDLAFMDRVHLSFALRKAYEDRKD